MPKIRDDATERRAANQAVAVSAADLGATGLAELLLAVLTGSVWLLGDAIHNLADVSTSAVVFLGFRLSPAARHRALPLRPGTRRGPGRDRDRGGHLGQRGVRRLSEHRKLLVHGTTTHVGAGIAGAVIGIVGKLAVARYMLVVGRRINSATLIADARHSWLDALSSAGALAWLIAVAAGQPWGDPVAGLAITAVVCHVGYQVTGDVVRRLADGVDPSVITTAGSVPGVAHAHARARWTGRTLRVEIEGWVDPGLPARDADTIGRQVADALARQLPEAGSLTYDVVGGPE